MENSTKNDLEKNESQTTSTGRISYVGIVNETNRPIFFQRYGGQQNNRSKQEHKIFEIMYNALDVMMERADDDRDSGMESDDGFMGCLGTFGRESLYGSLTNGGYKILVGVQTGPGGVEDMVTLRSALRRIEDALISAVLNPMQKPDDALRGKRILESIQDIVTWYG